MSLESLEDLLRVPPFHRWLDVRLLHAEPGRVVLRVPFQDTFIGNPTIPAWHGGITASLVDLAGGAALFAALDVPTPTVDMRIDYVRPALAARDLLCDARADTMGRTLAFVDATAFQLPPDAAWENGGGNGDPAGGRVVARGRAVYSTKGQAEPPPEGATPIG